MFSFARLRALLAAAPALPFGGAAAVWKKCAKKVARAFGRSLRAAFVEDLQRPEYAAGAELGFPTELRLDVVREVSFDIDGWPSPPGSDAGEELA